MEAIRAKNFGMKYNRGDFALQDIDLTINEGDFVILTGLIGSGKSTLLRQFKREFVAKDYEGSLKVLGKEVRDMTSADTLDVGYVMQFAKEQIVTDKVFHELSFGLENMGLSNDELRLRVSETAEYFALSDIMDKPTAELSGGQMQVVNLASVMAMRPKILLLDEPTSQLDEVTADKFLSLVYRLNRELGITIVIAEHRLDMLEKYDSMVIMKDGSIDYIGNDPRGYDELPIYTRVGEILGKKTDSIVKCRETLMQEVTSGNIDVEKCCFGEDNKQETRGEVVLKAHDVWYRYTKSGKDVLKGLDIALNCSEILSIIGGNGVGKSTLLKLLAGSLKCYKGSIKNYDKRVIYIPQNPCFVEDSVEHELSTCIANYVSVYKEENKKAKISPQEVENKREELSKMCREYVKNFDLQKVQKLSPYEISGGERAKLAILIGLLASPSVLLLDEPTKGLDAHGKKLVKDALLQLKVMNKSVILVSHDIELVATLSDRVATLFDGQIVSICMPKLLLSSNYLYTTTSSRIARGILDGVVTEDELLKAVQSAK